MSVIPAFQPDGLLPPGDHQASFDELRRSILVVGPNPTLQLWQVGIGDVFVDGSFAEDKDHPNDIDGYFVCPLDLLRTGELARQLNLLDPFKVWTWDPASRKPYRGYPKKQLPMWH